MSQSAQPASRLLNALREWLQLAEHQQLSTSRHRARTTELIAELSPALQLPTRATIQELVERLKCPDLTELYEFEPMTVARRMLPPPDKREAWYVEDEPCPSVILVEHDGDVNLVDATDLTAEDYIEGE